ncbi:MAG TPA: DinB family protein [Pyrinomonadaceae bacterium]|nr:DinB family protein [Pyrinomonadaceae bacterium]
MHPRIEEVVNYLDQTRADLSTAVDSVDAARRDERPGENQWSVAEILEHLNIIETRITQLLSGTIDAAKAAGLGPEEETASVLNSIDRSRIGDRSQKVTAPEMVKPRSETDAASAWLALQQSRERMRAALMSGDGLALGELKQNHPVLGLINMYQWSLFVGAHEARHTQQVNEIAQQFSS